jgi:uncharacterized protein involved in outer membrane biogenesis
MLWILGKLIKIVIILAILGLLGGLVFVSFMDPNNYKKQINHSLEEYAGLPLRVNGAVQWKLRPNAMLHIQQIVVNKPGTETTPILEIKDASMHFDLFSYLKGDLVIHDLELKDVNLDLTEAKNLTRAPTANKCLIQSLVVKNISVNMQNRVDNSNWQLKNANFSAKNVIVGSGKDFPVINVTGDLVNAGQHATINLDTVVALDASKHLLTLDPLKLNWNSTPFTGSAKIEQYDTDPILNGTVTMGATDVSGVLKRLDPYYANNTQIQPHTMQGQVVYSFATKEQILDLSNIHFQMDSGTIDGNFKISLIAPYQTEFTLTAEDIDFGPLSTLGKALFPTLPSQTLIPVDLVKNLTVNGKIAGTKLHLGNEMQIDQITLGIIGQNGIIQFAPLTVVAYGGTHNMAFNLDVINKQQPFLQLTEQADMVILEPWLKLIHESEKISGTASIKASLEAMGNDIASLKQTMTGAVNISIKDGTLYGFDADKLMSFTTKTVNDIFNEVSKAPSTDIRNLAIKKSSEWINTQQDGPKTKFDFFELKADIDQGISKKASIAMNNNVIDLKATGGFNLGDNTLNFDATLANKADVVTDVKALAAYIKKTPLAVLITGTIEKPLYGPNIQGFVVNIIQLAQTDMLNQALSKMVAATPPNGKTSKTATDLFVDSLQSLTK